MPTFKLDDLPYRVAFCDPASGKRDAQQIKRTRARSACVVAAPTPPIPPHNKTHVVILEAWAHRKPPTTLIKDLLDVGKRHNPKIFGIEANGLGAIVENVAVRDAATKGLRVPFIPVYQPTNVKKDWRIRQAISRWYNTRRLIFVEGKCTELLAELEAFPLGSTVDIIDALASLLALVPDRIIVDDPHRSEAEAVASYLRRQGADEHTIARRFAEVRAGYR